MPRFHSHMENMMASAILGLAMAFANASAESQPTINVQRKAGMVIIDVSMSVEASPQQAWGVLTDYDHMADFFPRLRSSKVIGQANGKTTIEQKGEVSYGPISVPFSAVREIELKPYAEIRSRAVGGSVKRGMAVTTLIPDGDGTKIVYHSESEPDLWVPPGIGPRFIENETRTQFESLRHEIVGRRNAEGHQK